MLGCLLLFYLMSSMIKDDSLRFEYWEYMRLAVSVVFLFVFFVAVLFMYY